LIACDQERKPTQNISLILEAGRDFGWRCMIAGIDWCSTRVKPGHNSPLSLTPFVLVRSFSISGNSKPGQGRSEWQAVLNRHGIE
jgi:hypothetical protein